MDISVRVGFIIAAIAGLYIIYLLLRHWIVKDLDIGWPSVVASIYLTIRKELKTDEENCNNWSFVSPESSYT